MRVMNEPEKVFQNILTSHKISLDCPNEKRLMLEKNGKVTMEMLAYFYVLRLTNKFDLQQNTK